jgi:helix-turn-helix protein
MGGKQKAPHLKGDARAAVRERYAKRYEAGATIRDLVEEDGRSYGSIRELLSEAGVLRHVGRIPGRGNRKRTEGVPSYGHAAADPSQHDLAADLARHGLTLKENG